MNSPTPNIDDFAESSGVHAVPNSAKEWRATLAQTGALTPLTEALLAAFGRLEEKHAEVAKQEAALRVALDRLPLAVFVVETGVVVARNAAADALLGAGFELDGGRLMASDEESRTRLASALQTPLAEGEFRTATTLGRDGTLRIAIFSEGDHLIVAASNPDRAPRALPKLYQGLFQLTPTEAKVAAHMVQGQAPREIAKSLGVGVETTRTHVKHILSKMGCHRQVEVVRKLVTSAGIFG